MRTATFILLGVVATACGGRVQMAGPSMTARREANFVQGASRALGCPNHAMQVGYVQSYAPNAHLYRAQGCGGIYESILFCAGNSCTWNEVPRAQAAMEMQCPTEQIAWSYAGVGAVAFAGCGATASFHYVDGQVVSDGVRR